MRTKVLLSIHPVAERGGSDYCLLRMVRAVVADGWECHVVMPGPSPLAEEFRAAGAVLHCVPMRRITTTEGLGYWVGYAVQWPLAVIRLARLARSVRADVIHSNSLHSWYGWAVALLVRRPHVWHGREIVVQSEAALRLERILTRHFADRVVVCSGPVAAQFPRSPVCVIPDVVGPDDGLSPSRAGRFRAAMGIADDVPLIGSAGRIDTWKGVDVLLDAAPIVARDRPDAVILVAGGPVAGKEGYAEALAARAAQLPNVRWLGPRRDMADLLADLDVLAVPSTQPEPFASVAVEALETGVPVVATDHGGSPEMLADFLEMGCRLVPPGDAAALGSALAGALPPGPSSTAGRRNRRPMHVAQSTTFSQVFDHVLESSGV